MIDTCRHCHSQTLEVSSCRVTMTGVKLTVNGFFFGDAQTQDTDSEIVYCTTCKTYDTLRYEE